MDLQLIYVDGQPFHLPGTKIYREANGSLTYECPHCPPQEVRRHWENELAPYATKRSA